MNIHCSPQGVFISLPGRGLPNTRGPVQRKILFLPGLPQFVWLLPHSQFPSNIHALIVFLLLFCLLFASTSIHPGPHHGSKINSEYARAPPFSFVSMRHVFFSSAGGLLHRLSRSHFLPAMNIIPSPSSTMFCINWRNPLRQHRMENKV